jgi:hypothetical protein
VYLYVLINIIIGIIGVLAALYLLFRLFAWRQGDARFFIDCRHREPFTLTEISTDRAVFETVVPFSNRGKQGGTIMDFYPRHLLPSEQYDKCIVHSRLTNTTANRDDGYWESVIILPRQGGKLRVTVELISKNGNIREDLHSFPDMPIDLVYQVVARSEWYIHKARITLKSSEILRALQEA